MAQELIKEVSNAVLYKAFEGANKAKFRYRVLIKGVRFSYLHVDAPYKYEGAGADPKAVAKYSTDALLPKATHKPAVLLCREVEDYIMKESGVMVPKDRRYIRNGDETGKEQAKGMWILGASEKEQPSVRDPAAKKVPQERIKGVAKSGYWGNILIEPWYNKTYKRIGAGLRAIQITREDELLGNGGGGISEEDVEDVFKPEGDDSGSGFDDDDDTGI